MKKFVAELKEIFAANPTAVTLLLVSDGNIFLQEAKHLANDHAKKRGLDVEEIHRLTFEEVLADSEKEASKTPETPKDETSKVETPKVETPKVETPKVETPKVETPKVETPKVETPKVETPKVDAPAGDKASTKKAGGNKNTGK
jgi:outer membrane biosynthesis protein TonB